MFLPPVQNWILSLHFCRKSWVRFRASHLNQIFDTWLDLLCSSLSLCSARGSQNWSCVFTIWLSWPECGADAARTFRPSLIVCSHQRPVLPLGLGLGNPSGTHLPEYFFPFFGPGQFWRWAKMILFAWAIYLLALVQGTVGTHGQRREGSWKSHFHWIELVVEVYLAIQSRCVFTAVNEVSGNCILNVLSILKK